MDFRCTFFFDGWGFCEFVVSFGLFGLFGMFLFRGVLWEDLLVDGRQVGRSAIDRVWACEWEVRDVSCKL